MAKKPFFPDDTIEQLVWMNTFRSALPGYATKYGISAVELAAMDADGNWLGYWIGIHTAIQTFAQNVTAFKNEAAFGLPSGAAVSVPPALAAFPASPPAVLPGIFTRYLAIANRIKSHVDYTVADGEAMGLEGAEQSPVDVPNLKPVLKLVVAGPNLVDVNWKKNRTEGVEIWVKRGSGAWALLAYDTTTPKYVDTQAFPATEETWQYKAIYHYAGSQAGMWSEVVNVTVVAG